MTNTKKTENGVKRTGLYWPGKRMEVERVALPFQVVETVNVSRATREEGVISSPESVRWHAARQLRNAASHPERQMILTPGNAIGILERVGDDINSLFSGG